MEDVVEGNKNIDNLICPICYNIVKDPISCNSTKKSHSFYQECIEKSLEINDKCPICKQTFESEINKKIVKLLQKLKFKCKYAEEGCPKILDYSMYFKHIDKCGFRELLYECQVGKYNYEKKLLKKCGYKGTFKKVIKHFKKCAFLEYSCLFCNQKFLQVNLIKHFNSSCKFLIIFDENCTYIGQHDGEYYMKGYGKIFFKEGTIHEGEVNVEGKNGFGISTYSDGTIYKGEWKNDRAEGYGFLYNNGELEYKGEFKDDQKDGIGIGINEVGRYEGEWKNDKREGYGICYFDTDNINNEVALKK